MVLDIYYFDELWVNRILKLLYLGKQLKAMKSFWLTFFLSISYLLEI